MRSWNAQVSARTEAAAALADRVASLTASATGADDGVRATVASSGILTGLEIGDEVELTGAGLATEIIRVMRRAQATLAERVAEAVEETVGTDSETGKAVLDSFAQRFPPEPSVPVMPAPPPFPTFQSRPTLPHQAPGGGFESGRDSRAR
jgi:phenylpyruvate tautomerase PptA (4-oxalocrotonate tautomerase family)